MAPMEKLDGGVASMTDPVIYTLVEGSLGLERRVLTEI